MHTSFRKKSECKHKDAPVSSHNQRKKGLVISELKFINLITIHNPLVETFRYSTIIVMTSTILYERPDFQSDCMSYWFADI